MAAPVKSEMEHRYTSTGIKWWRHQEAMESYRASTGRTVISTHISPEGACNLKCPYCSVTHRDTHSRISPGTILDYVDRLQSRGLKAVILTGGGEPTAYPDFNTLVAFLRFSGLRVALITNGTLAHKVDETIWPVFDWIRVSVNFFPGWEGKIGIPTHLLRKDCIVGCSTVFTDRHESALELARGWESLYAVVSRVADRVGASYVRVLPNCLLPQDRLFERHRELDALLAKTGDPRFFHQDKNHRAPSCSTCHQSFFRPYLSEEPNPWDGKPGTVFPCDSVVLNAPAPGSEGYGKFMSKYALCRPDEVLDYLDGKRSHAFDPRSDCHGCVFTDTVEMLGRWKETGEGEFRSDPLVHEEFV